MKVNLYLDIWPTQQEGYMCATNQPTLKCDGSKRYMISVNLPDDAFFGKVDGVLPVEEVKEVDKDILNGENK